jgi:hypothetical protein
MEIYVLRLPPHPSPSGRFARFLLQKMEIQYENYYSCVTLSTPFSGALKPDKETKLIFPVRPPVPMHKENFLALEGFSGGERSDRKI